MSAPYCVVATATDICLPNHLHAEVTLAAAAAGKHVICEKPLSLTLEEADKMIDACARAGRKLMYAEELCFAPKYERVRQLAQKVPSGAFTRCVRARNTQDLTPIGSGGM